MQVDSMAKQLEEMLSKMHDSEEGKVEGGPGKGGEGNAVIT